MLADPSRQTSPRLFRWVAALFLTVAVAGVVVFVIARRRPERWPEPVRTATFVGDSTCLSCHGDKASFEQTAHRLTTRYPSSGTIIGSFREGENELHTPNPALRFHMHADSTGFYQTAILGKAPDTTTRTERVAIVAGSARKGQSFLYWNGNRLFQMPVSYWKTLGKWINSPGPGYVDGRANFERPISSRCFECHATWIEPIPDPSVVNRFVGETAILGITCERCHAAGREHVTRERSLFHAVRSPAIVNPARLSRERKMEACGQCHGGLGNPLVPSFSYVAGQPLDKYVHLTTPPPDAPVDVHGNQIAALSRSKCFRASEMTCLTCHNVHQTERDVTALSGKCLTCHQEQSCGLFQKEGHALAGRCVNCHMPTQASNLIVSALEGQQKQALVRNHWIRVYADSAIK